MASLSLVSSAKGGGISLDASLFTLNGRAVEEAQLLEISSEYSAGIIGTTL